MTTLLMDPCEDVNGVGPWTGGGGTATIVTGRTGNGMQLTGVTTKIYQVSAPNESTTFTLGFAFKTPSLALLLELARFSSDAGSTVHNLIRVTTAGALTITRSTTVIGTTATGVIAINTWYYVEIQAKLGDAGVGSYELRLDGAAVIGPTVGDTKNAGTKTVYDTFRIGGTTSGPALVYDDLYFKVGVGETFLGPINITTGATVNVWNGSAFVDAPVKVFNGSAFVDATAVKVFNGTAFVDAV